jgi:hypothetical protein
LKVINDRITGEKKIISSNDEYWQLKDLLAQKGGVVLREISSRGDKVESQIQNPYMAAAEYINDQKLNRTVDMLKWKY